MTQLSHHIYFSVDELSSDWNQISSDIFLSTAYLKAQENALPKNFDVFYVGIFQEDKLVGKSVIQRVKVKSNELFRRNPLALRENLLQILNLNLLCLGNLKLTGEHAYAFLDNIDEFQVLKTLDKALNEIKRISKNEKLPIQLILIKDFYPKSLSKVQQVFKDYESLSAQPNMLLEIRKDWKSFDEYLDSMRTKYRTRAKRAFKKSKEIEFRDLTWNEIKENEEEIYSLYYNVLQNAGFSLYVLPKHYFAEMKMQLKHKFHMKGGFYKGQLVCFYSMIENEEQLQTGFLGYDKSLQKKHQLYLNILYQMTKYGIDHGFEAVDYSRTALEIKSSIGAEPRPVFGLLKHTHPWMHRVLRSSFNKIYQKEEWIQRHPFKN